MLSKKPTQKATEVVLQIDSNVQRIPKNVELEATILGACMLDKEAFNIVNRILPTEEAFSHYGHRTIFNSMRKLAAKNQPIDMLTVVDRIQKDGFLVAETTKQNDNRKLSKKAQIKKLYSITSYEVVEVTNKVASAANVEYHSRIVYQEYMRRKAIENAYIMIREAQDPTFDVFDLYDKAARNMRVVNPQNVIQTKSMNEAMKEGSKAPPSQWIAGTLVKENEVVIIFADAGTGKSVFAFQIGDAASKGVNVFGDSQLEGVQNHAKPKKVVFFDFELEESELFGRYATQDDGMYQFNDNFKRASLNPDFCDYDNADELIMNEVQAVCDTEKPELIIIDNITYMTSESGDSRIASELMKKLLRMQKATPKLSIIVIAHTPKRDRSLPIELRHLAGSMNLANFAKSVVAVSKSRKDPSLRYIKHVKCRNGVTYFEEDNVIECMLVKERNFLQYQYRDSGPEKDHLIHKDDSDIEDEILHFIEAERTKSEPTPWRKIGAKILLEFEVTWTHTTARRKYSKWKMEQGAIPADEAKELDEYARKDIKDNSNK